jgi:hypothetical protein
MNDSSFLAGLAGLAGLVSLTCIVLVIGQYISTLFNWLLNKVEKKFL